MIAVEFHPAASTEAEDAYDWYLQRSERVAEAFKVELRGAGIRLAENPRRHAIIARGASGRIYRRVLFLRFPFSLVYQEEVAAAFVLAVPHGHRRPMYWLERSR